MTPTEYSSLPAYPVGFQTDGNAACSLCEELRPTANLQEAIELVQTGAWVMVGAKEAGACMMYLMGRIA
ncbi:MAG: hypothetical protein VB087_12635 [Candidatus Limiplasma sp.]|nr:hypothetical protein [Candidatus Limiplasma sp.]